MLTRQKAAHAETDFETFMQEAILGSSQQPSTGSQVHLSAPAELRTG
jgi:hypothetical protein